MLGVLKILEAPQVWLLRSKITLSKGLSLETIEVPLTTKGFGSRGQIVFRNLGKCKIKNK